MPKEILDLTLTRHSSAVPWGFTLSGGRDQGLTVKVGCVLHDSVADNCGLQSRDFIWTISGQELSVERGDHIVPSFEEISGKTKQRNGHEPLLRRRDTGRAYYAAAMQSHGLPGKIPSSFTTVGKPYFENIQYNTPIEMYDDGTVDEMVKIMNSPATAGLNPLTKPETVEVVDAPKVDKIGESNGIAGLSNLGWTVRTSNKSFMRTYPLESSGRGQGSSDL